MRQAIQYVGEMSEGATAEIGDVEVWKSDSGRIWLDVNGEVGNNEDLDDYRLLGTVKGCLY